MQISKIFIKIVDKRVNNLTLKNKQATIYSLFHASLATRKKKLIQYNTALTLMSVEYVYI